MPTQELKRELGPVSAIMIVVGAVIGSGIFLKPWEISQYLPGVIWILALWVFLGVVSLFGGLAYAELGAMYPEAGGQYAFLREGWGRLIAFLFGWCFLLIINTGGIAALAVAFASSLSTLVPLSPAAQLGVSVAMILALAITNHLGVKSGAILQNVSAVSKLVALGALVLAGAWVGTLFMGERTLPPASAMAPPVDLLTGMVAASVAIFWAYEGWYQLPFNAAELKNPQRDLPRGLIYGLLILIATYLSVNAVYLYVVPIEEMRSLSRDIDVPRAVMSSIFGAHSADWLALLICLSVFGAANPNLLSGPRAFYAMATDGLAVKLLTRVHPVYRTPTVAIWSQAIWAIMLIFVLKTFRDLTDYVVFASLIFYALTVASVYRLRWKEPNKPRPFRCTGYPWTPALFIAVVLFVDAYTLVSSERRLNALMGLFIILSGIPVYLWLRARRRP
ncbi:MAG: APC family permease [Acidobacteriota bacterium]